MERFHEFDGAWQEISGRKGQNSNPNRGTTAPDIHSSYNSNSRDDSSINERSLTKMVVINGMAGTKDLVCTENTDNMKAADDEQTSKPEILRETAHFWSHVKMNEAGIEQPWFQRLNEHRKRR